MKDQLACEFNESSQDKTNGCRIRIRNIITQEQMGEMIQWNETSRKKSHHTYKGRKGVERGGKGKALSRGKDSMETKL